MLPRIFATGVLAAFIAVPVTWGQNDLANLREDIRGLSQRVGELSLKVEQLERENAALRQSTQGLNQTYVTLTQLNNAITDLTASIRSAVANSKKETLEQVGVQMEKLAKQTNTAIDSLAKGMVTRPAVQSNFADDYPKEGVKYTVQKGDTLDSIAKKMGAKQQDVINANKIADPARIVVGQTLFIPGAK
jgi:LysM repeat protein